MPLPSSVRPVVALDDACKVYLAGSAQVAALDHVRLCVGAGEYLSVMGASGSGKSTLLNVLGTLDRLDRGTYELDGRRTDHLDDDELSLLRAHRIGFVFQSFHLMPRYTARENVELALLYARVKRSHWRDASMHALERVGLAGRAEHLPSQLSGGQQQRVSLARALVTAPSLLLADEPTGALDSVTTGEILDLFDKMHGEGVTLIVVTHDREVAARAERMVLMRDGRVVQDERVGKALEASAQPSALDLTWTPIHCLRAEGSRP